MKKLLFLVIITLFSFQMEATEQFDELNLRGGWELVSYTGRYDLFNTPEVISEETPSISSCKYLYIGEIPTNASGYIEVLFPGLTTSVELDWVGSLNGAFYKPEIKDVEDTDGYWIGITDYAISNGNKLHLLFSFGPSAIHFVIESLTATELKIKSYDGNLTANYKRLSNPSNVKELAAPTSSKEEIYNLNGLKATSATNGVKIVRQGGKVTKEIR